MRYRIKFLVEKLRSPTGAALWEWALVCIFFVGAFIAGANLMGANWLRNVLKISVNAATLSIGTGYPPWMEPNTNQMRPNLSGDPVLYNLMKEFAEKAYQNAVENGATTLERSEIGSSLVCFPTNVACDQSNWFYWQVVDGSDTVYDVVDANGNEMADKADIHSEMTELSVMKVLHQCNTNPTENCMVYVSWKSADDLKDAVYENPGQAGLPGGPEPWTEANPHGSIYVKSGCATCSTFTVVPKYEGLPPVRLPGF